MKGCRIKAGAFQPKKKTTIDQTTFKIFVYLNKVTFFETEAICFMFLADLK